jgi:hypothetical protein
MLSVLTDEIIGILNQQNSLIAEHRYRPELRHDVSDLTGLSRETAQRKITIFAGTTRQSLQHFNLEESFFADKDNDRGTGHRLL